MRFAKTDVLECFDKQDRSYRLAVPVHSLDIPTALATNLVRLRRPEVSGWGFAARGYRSPTWPTSLNPIVSPRLVIGLYPQSATRIDTRPV